MASPPSSFSLFPPQSEDSLSSKPDKSHTIPKPKANPKTEASKPKSAPKRKRKPPQKKSTQQFPVNLPSIYGHIRFLPQQPQELSSVQMPMMGGVVSDDNYYCDLCAWSNDLLKSWGRFGNEMEMKEHEFLKKSEGREAVATASSSSSFSATAASEILDLELKL